VAAAMVAAGTSDIYLAGTAVIIGLAIVIAVLIAVNEKPACLG
jgi:hypothetical protein